MSLLQTFRSVLDRVRRNHALEHATINLLSQRYPGAQVLGLSGPFGFTLYTSLDVGTVERMVPQALVSLQHGMTGLAYHENCGTNLVMTATLTTMATLLWLRPRRRSTLGQLIERFPQAILLNAIALLVAAPLSHWVQIHMTTASDLEGVEITSVAADRQGDLHRVRIQTRQV